MEIPLSKSGRKRLFVPDFTPFYHLISDFDNGHTVVKIPIFIYWNAMIRETQAIFKPKPKGITNKNSPPCNSHCGTGKDPIGGDY